MGFYCGHVMYSYFLNECFQCQRQRKAMPKRYVWIYLSCLHLFSSSTECNIGVVGCGPISFLTLHRGIQWSFLGEKNDRTFVKQFCQSSKQIHNISNCNSSFGHSLIQKLKQHLNKEYSWNSYEYDI